MKIYAFIQHGEVSEVIQPATWPDGSDVDIKDRFAPEFVDQMVEITNIHPQPEAHWTYSDGIFHEPSFVNNDNE